MLIVSQLGLKTFAAQEVLDDSSMAVESLAGYPMPPSCSQGPMRFPFAAYELVLPDEAEGESWVGKADPSGCRLSSVRRVSTRRWVKLQAVCIAHGCDGKRSCSHKLYWHVRLTLGGWGNYPGPDKQTQRLVQYSRLVLFATKGLPCEPKDTNKYVVHHMNYVRMRVGKPDPRTVADDSDTDKIKWETRQEHGHEHFGISVKRMPLPVFAKRPAAANAIVKKPAACISKRKPAAFIRPASSGVKNSMPHIAPYALDLGFRADDARDPYLKLFLRVSPRPNSSF